jgi:hypothetical protein
MPAELDNSVSGTEVSTLTDLAKDVLPYYSTEINKKHFQCNLKKQEQKQTNKQKKNKSKIKVKRNKVAY